MQLEHLEISCAKHKLCRFVRKQFHVLFHWPFRPSFNLSLTVLVHYRFLSIFSLGGWFPQIPPEYVHRSTRDTPRGCLGFAYETFTLYGQQFHAVLLPQLLPCRSPTTPRCFRRNCEVWAFAISLAATEAISIDFSSSGYLDVSVPRVPSAAAIFQPKSKILLRSNRR